MKTQHRPLAAEPTTAPEAVAQPMFAIDQRVSFVNPRTRQRESLPLLTALTAACEYLRTGAPFELVDLDDELLAHFDGARLEAREPLAEVLFATTQVLSSIVQKSLSEAFAYLVDDEQAQRVLARMRAQREGGAEQAGATPPENAGPESHDEPGQPGDPEHPGEPEHLGVFGPHGA